MSWILQIEIDFNWYNRW